MINKTEIKQIAHDLRNELSIIYSYAQILEMSLKSSAAEELKLAQAISNSVKKMTALINERMDV